MILSIFHHELKALRRIVSEDEERHILNGVCIESSGNGAILLVACDGRRLAVRKTRATNQNLHNIKFQFVMPVSAIDSLASIAEGALALVVIDYNDSTKVIRIDFKHTIIEVLALNGTYPDWRSKVPTEIKTGISVPMNAEYLNQLAQVASALENVAHTHISIHSTSALEPIVVTNPEYGNDFLALIMPLRDLTPVNIPHWIK